MNGKLFVGYGDWSANLGPVYLRYFDPTNNEFSERLISANTESLARFKTIGDTVYALHTDPRRSSRGGYIYANASDLDSWNQYSELEVAQFYDITEFGESIFLVGSGGADQRSSIIYESRNQGESWHLALEIRPPNIENVPSSYSRFYGGAVINERFYTQNLVYNDFQTMPSSTYDGTTWSDGPTIETESGYVAEFVNPINFADQIVVRDGIPGFPSESRLLRFDGTMLDIIHPNGEFVGFFDFVVDGEQLYALTTDRRIIATNDLELWTTVFESVPPRARSIAVIGSTVYLGSVMSGIYAGNLTVALNGDFNGDGHLDVNDLDLLVAEIQSGSVNPSFDVLPDGAIDANDLGKWVRELKNTYFGDSNLDGEFNSSDMVSVFRSGQYEDDRAQNSTWSTGDWNGDLEFTTSDLVVAFRDGGYERGPRQIANVPEPNSFLLAAIVLLCVPARMRIDRTK